MKTANVVTIRDGMVERIRTFYSTPEGFISTKAVEHEFLREVSTHVSNWDEYTNDDVEAICDNGYEGFGCGSVQIFWSDEDE